MITRNESSEFQLQHGKFERRAAVLREKVQGLTNAATADMIGKVNEVETMVGAFKRDISEINSEGGADYDTTSNLGSVIDSKLTSLEHEIEALSLGNPTTVSAAVDALMNVGTTK